MSDQSNEELLPDDPTLSQVQPFQLEGKPARGRAVRLHGVVDEILGKHRYPDGIATLLAHALTLVAILGNTLKFEGKLILQAKGNAAVTSLVADYKSPGKEGAAGEVRGWVNFDQEKYDRLVEQGLDASREIQQFLGAGHLAFTIDQGPDTERYQGIVGLEGATLAECAQKYFDTSEQLPTAIKLSAARTEEGWRAGGIMLQHLASTGGFDTGDVNEEDTEEGWREGAILMASTKDDELLSDDLPLQQLLFRLFHERGVRVFDPIPVGVLCQCTRERIGAVLGQFDDVELSDMVVDGSIVVTCEFCNKNFDFTPPAEAA
jgi:molecular chaperone Hsp33